MIRYKKLLAFVDWARAQDPPVDLAWARADRAAAAVTEVELRELVTRHNQASPSPVPAPVSVPVPAPEPEFQRLRAPPRARAALAGALVAYVARVGLDAAAVALAAERVRSGRCAPQDFDAARALRSLLGGVQGRDLERAFVAVGAPPEMPGAAGMLEGLFAPPGPRLVRFNRKTMRVRRVESEGAAASTAATVEGAERKRGAVAVKKVAVAVKKAGGKKVRGR